jgi:two-component system, NtrC family, sensor kinase
LVPQSGEVAGPENVPRSAGTPHVRSPNAMRPFRFSLTFSILSLLACLLALTWILLSLISFKTAEKDMLVQKNEEVRVLLSSFISILPEDPALLDGRGAAGKFAANLAGERDFAGLLVVDRRGKVLFNHSAGKGDDVRLRETLSGGGESSAFSSNGLIVSRYAPILKGGMINGAARLSLSLVEEKERMQRSRHIFLAYFILDFLLLFGLGSYLLSRIVVVPIKRLLAATERITAGNYSHAVTVPGSAEVAELAESFSLMQDALRSKREEVETYVNSLEKANRDLQIAREETIRSEKMASVGLLAAGMAHEIGTPLSAIIGYAGILRDELKENQSDDDYLRRIEEEANRIDRIVRGLLDYARPTKADCEDLDLGALVRDTLELFADQGAFRNIRSSIQVEAALPPVNADRHQLQQVLINLFINARDAMPDGGTITVDARSSELGAAQRQAAGTGPTVMIGRRKEDFNRAFSSSFADTCAQVPCVRLEIRDTGEGIPPENLNKVFDPFFTTKEPGKGTGLGLAICARIIDTFRGRITVESTPGVGTAFVLWLPVTGSAR